MQDRVRRAHQQLVAVHLDEQSGMPSHQVEDGRSVGLRRHGDVGELGADLPEEPWPPEAPAPHDDSRGARLLEHARNHWLAEFSDQEQLVDAA